MDIGITLTPVRFRVMRALWAGELVYTEVEGAKRGMQFIQPEGFVNTQDPIPLHR